MLIYRKFSFCSKGVNLVCLKRMLFHPSLPRDFTVQYNTMTLQRHAQDHCK